MWLSLLFLYPNNSISNRSCVAQHKSLISITNHGVHIVMRDCASPNNIRTRTCPEKGRAGAVLVESGEGACSQKHASILWLVEGPKKKSLRGYWSHTSTMSWTWYASSAPVESRHPAAGQNLHNAIPIPHATPWRHCCGWQRWAPCLSFTANQVFNGVWRSALAVCYIVNTAQLHQRKQAKNN